MKRIVWLLCLCAALLALAGCSGTRQAEAPQEAPVVLPYASSLAKQGITGSITLPKRPERVVTLTNSPVLALYELGVPQAAVPDTKILQWPEGLEKQAKKIQTGMRSNIDLESVLAQEPDLLFLDEPTTFLDISYQFEILQLVKDLNRRLGTGVVLVLHDLGQALEISDRVVIRNGRKYCEGPPEAVITPQLMRRVYQVDCDVLYVPSKTGTDNEGNEKRVIDPAELMKLLGEKKISSILLEGGGTLAWSCLEAGAVQKVIAYIAPKVFGGAGAKNPVAGAGVDAPDEAVRLEIKKVAKVGDDIKIIYNVENGAGKCSQE